MLTRHGFVIPNNPFDTCPYRIGDVSFTLHRGVGDGASFPPARAPRRGSRETRGASFLGESTYDTEPARLIADSGGGKKRRKRASSPNESERDVIVLTFLAESARRLSAAIVAAGKVVRRIRRARRVGVRDELDFSDGARVRDGPRVATGAPE